jgi:hypothetical protein
LELEDLVDQVELLELEDLGVMDQGTLETPVGVEEEVVEEVDPPMRVRGGMEIVDVEEVEVIQEMVEVVEMVKELKQVIQEMVEVLEIQAIMEIHLMLEEIVEILGLTVEQEIPETMEIQGVMVT